MSKNFQSVPGDETRGSVLARGTPSPEYVKKYEDVAMNFSKHQFENNRKSFVKFSRGDKIWKMKIATQLPESPDFSRIKDFAGLIGFNLHFLAIQDHVFGCVSRHIEIPSKNPGHLAFLSTLTPL